MIDYNKEVLKIKYIVETEFNLEPEDLNKQCRKKELALPRLIFANMLLHDLKLKIAQIPKFLNRDRTLFYHYKKLHKSYMSDARTYPEYYRSYNKILGQYLNMSDAILQAQHEQRSHQLLYDVECDIEKLEKKRQMLIEQIW